MGILPGSAHREANHAAGLIAAQLRCGVLAGQDNADLGREVRGILLIPDVDNGEIIACGDIVRVFEKFLDTNVSALTGASGLWTSRRGFLATFALAFL